LRQSFPDKLAAISGDTPAAVMLLSKFSFSRMSGVMLMNSFGLGSVIV
jgi:hypothetical protein